MLPFSRTSRPTSNHLIRSHAQKTDIPGTIRLKPSAGDDTAYGQALFPVPDDSLNDPLQWPIWEKRTILVVYCAYSFLCNSTLIGSSVYTGLYAQEFGISETKASSLSSYPTLAFGLGCLVLIPMYAKFGRRPTMILSMLLYTFGVLGCAQAKTFAGLMAARIIHAVGSGVCEALPIQCVDDVFFLHERGKRLGYYTAALCIGTIGPLPAGYMLAAGHGWRLFFYVEFGFALALLFAAFFLVPETAYQRRTESVETVERDLTDRTEEPAKRGLDVTEEVAASSGREMRPRTPYIRRLQPWSSIDRQCSFTWTILRSFIHYLVPCVFWVITSYGLYIGCGALAFNFTFPLKIVAPPYNWSSTNSGLIAVSNALGYLLGIPLVNMSDRFAARATRQNASTREAEMRLPILWPAMFLGPAALVLFGCAAQFNLHWITYFVAVTMFTVSALFFFTITIAYAVDSYNANTSEILIAINIGKNAISFGMGLNLLTWILRDGYAVVISGIFGGLLLANNLMLLIFIYKGKKIRMYFATSWVTRVKKT